MFNSDVNLNQLTGTIPDSIGNLAQLSYLYELINLIVEIFVWSCFLIYFCWSIEQGIECQSVDRDNPCECWQSASTW